MCFGPKVTQNTSIRVSSAIFGPPFCFPKILIARSYMTSMLSKGGNPSSLCALALKLYKLLVFGFIRISSVRYLVFQKFKLLYGHVWQVCYPMVKKRALYVLWFQSYWRGSRTDGRAKNCFFLNIGFKYFQCVWISDSLTQRTDGRRGHYREFWKKTALKMYLIDGLNWKFEF